jgi:hypothetical protein
MLLVIALPERDHHQRACDGPVVVLRNLDT